MFCTSAWDLHIPTFLETKNSHKSGENLKQVVRNVEPSMAGSHKLSDTAHRATAHSSVISMKELVEEEKEDARIVPPPPEVD